MTRRRGTFPWRATDWAWRQDRLPAVSKLVLLALAALATGEDHRVKLEATATVDEICTRTSLARRTVQTHLRHLEQTNHIVPEERQDENGARIANRWHLNVDGLAPVHLPLGRTTR